MPLQKQQRALAKARSGQLAHHSGVNVAGSQSQPGAPRDTSTTGPHRRHSDRGSGDDDSAERRSTLPTYVRFSDLTQAGIVANWTTLLRLIDDEGFPPGVMIGPNSRAWRLDEVVAWLASRPSARKAVPPDAVHPRVRDKRRAAAENATP